MARFEADSVDALEADWPVALRETAAWRTRRRDKALSLHLHVVVPRDVAWAAMAFVARKLLTSVAAFPEEFAGLRIEPIVFAAPGMQIYLGMTLNSEATVHARGDEVRTNVRRVHQ